MKKIYITRRLPKIAKELLSIHFEVDEFPENKPLPAEKLQEVIQNYDGILTCISEKVTKELLNQSTNLKAIANYAAGLDNIDLEAAKKKGISIYNTPNIVTDSTADMTFALLFALIRKISAARKFVRENKWLAWDPELFLGEELAGKTWGIIGFGKIGKAVAERAKGFGVKVIYYNRSRVENDHPSTKQVPLDQLLQESDYISLHVPLTDETKQMINSETIAKMTKKPILLNLARGAVVDSSALLEALQSGQIKGAGLDVTDPEPIGGKHPLCNMENCIVIPHIGTATYECRHNMAKAAAENLIRHFTQQAKGDSVQQQVENVMTEVLGIAVSSETTMANLPQWDSLRQIQLISALEKEFDIEIRFQDAMNMIHGKEILAVIRKYMEKSAVKQEPHATEQKILASKRGVLIDETKLYTHQKLGIPYRMDYNNVYELFQAKLEQDPTKDFVIFPDKRKTVTYQEFHARFTSTASYLQKQGLIKGDRIALIIPNSLDFVTLYFAGLSIGMTIVPINPDLSPREMEYIINNCESKFVFYDLVLRGKIDAIKQNNIRKDVSFIAAPDATERADLSQPQSVSVELTDNAVIIYTSGTTGDPKGAVINHLNLLSDAKTISEWFKLTPNSRTLCVLPMFHNNGQVITLLTPLYAGGSTVIVQAKSSLMSFWKLIEKYNINWTSVMPSILAILLSMPTERIDNSMQGILCGGQILTKEVQRKFEERFNVPIFEGYGLTETTSFACFNNFPASKRKERTVGIALPINHIVILDQNDRQLKPYEEGEICIRGFNVVNGYYNLHEKNKFAFRNGWFHSGDYGYKDEEGYLHFKTRKDHLIIKGGENIYPSELENIMFNHPTVAECAVIGIPSKLLGEEICAFVKLNEGMSMQEDELHKFLIGKIAGYKQPKKIIIIDHLEDMSEMPRTPTKKVLYRNLKKYYLEKIEKLTEKIAE